MSTSSYKKNDFWSISDREVASSWKAVISCGAKTQYKNEEAKYSLNSSAENLVPKNIR